METITIILVNGFSYVFHEILSHEKNGNTLHLCRPEDAIFAEEDIPTEWQPFGRGTNQIKLELPSDAVIEVK